MSKELIELSNALAQATDRAASSVVAVHTERRGSSSGIVWRSGVIVTSEHALRRDEEIQVTLPNGRVVSASLAGRDPSTDIAVLKCAEASNAAQEFGDVAALKPGSLTLVVGRTRVSGPVAALGVVSLVAPDRRTWTGASIVPYIRLDVGLQPTAVGGAVIDANGRTVGLATPRFARFGAIAVPASSINKITDILLQKDVCDFVDGRSRHCNRPEARKARRRQTDGPTVRVDDSATYGGGLQPNVESDVRND